MTDAATDATLNPIVIDDQDDPRIAMFRDVRDKDLRGRDRQFMAESDLVIRRLLRTPEKLAAILCSDAKFESLRPALHDAASVMHTRDQQLAPVYIAPLPLMVDIAGFHIHRGVLAAGHRPWPGELTIEYALKDVLKRDHFRLVIAEGVMGVDNMGTLFRNAAGFGVDAIILDPTSCDPLYRKAIRVSMGHVLSIPWAIARDWPSDLNRLKEEWGVTVVAAECGADAVPVSSVQWPARSAVLMGGEHHGVRSETLARCDVIAEIPMQGSVPSLNVSIANAIFLHEMTNGGGGVRARNDAR